MLTDGLDHYRMLSGERKLSANVLWVGLVYQGWDTTKV